MTDRKIAENNEELSIPVGNLVGVKENICIVDMEKIAGSKILENYKPPFDATAIGKIKKCVGIVIGKRIWIILVWGVLLIGQLIQMFNFQRPKLNDFDLSLMSREYVLCSWEVE